MAINPAIALGVKGLELQDPLAQYGRVAAIQGAQQQNQLAQLQMQAAQREQESTNALNRAYAEAYNPQTGETDINKLRGSLATGGFGSKLPAVEKGLLELQTARTAQQKGQADLLDSKLKQSRQFLETLDPSSPGAAEAYMQWHRANHADPVIGKALEARGITVDQSMNRIQQLLQTPGGLSRLIDESKLGTEKFMEMNKPQLSTTDVGGQVVSRTFQPLTGELTQIGTQTKTMAPGEAERIDISRGQLRTAQGQLSVAQQRLAQEAQGVTYQQDAQGNLIALPSRLPSGGVPTARPVTGEGGAPVKGKPSAFAEKAAAQRTQMGKDLNFAIKELSDITKEGGLIDQSTGSGAGRLVDIGAGFVGQATKGAIAIGKIEPVADLALKMVPRFEGPQSDKDTASYKAAAGQLADPTLPTAIRKEAGKTVLRLMQQRKNQFVTSDMAAEGAGAAPAGNAPDPLGIR